MENGPRGGEKLDETYRYHGHSKAECDRYGKPHIGAHYTEADNTHRYHRDSDTCVICGRPATDVHHWPRLGAGHCGIFVLRTMKGTFLLKPSLFALCRTCHTRIHDSEIKLDWIWDTPDDSHSWYDGTMLAAIRPHSPELYQHGRWRFSWNGGGFEYRGVIGDYGQRKVVRTPFREEPAQAAGCHDED